MKVQDIKFVKNVLLIVTMFFDAQGNIYSVNDKGCVNLAEALRNLANEIKDKWINIHCTEQERQDIMELANKHNMPVSKFIFWLIDKQRNEDEEELK